MCKTERARNVITVFSVPITVKSGNRCYVSWLLTALCWAYFARYNTHIRVVLWKGTEELSFWRNNYFPLNLWLDASLWEEFSSKFLTLLPSLFPSKGVLLASLPFYPFLSLYGAEHHNICKPPNYLKIEITITVFHPSIPVPRRNIFKEKKKSKLVSETMISAEPNEG